MQINLFLKVCFILCTHVILVGCSDSSSPANPYAATIAEGRAAVKEAMAETAPPRSPLPWWRATG